jgi:LacI family transcriptional regulator
MTLLSQRTVASQIAAQLRTSIENGVWCDWLPSERVLCQMMQASRNTVRAAINQLKAEGLVKSEKPTGNRIVRGGRRARKKSRMKSVGIVVPEAVYSLRPLIGLWIDELKDMLLEEECVLRVHDGQQYYRTNPAAALAKLIKQNQHDAWVLVLSSEAMQQWFVRSKVPCLVAGSIYPGIQLPFYDFDYRAICRHAAGVLLRLGHRRIAFLNHKHPRAGEVAGELGFNEGIRASSHPETFSAIVYHCDDVESVRRALEHLRRNRKGFPTALVVSSSYAYVAVVTLLANMRLRVPQDVSLISRDDDPLLRAIYPTPARYTVSPHAFARRLIGPISRLIRALPVAHAKAYFLPKFTSGESTGAPGVGTRRTTSM